jgi:mannose-6-phosphate isomerase-like protein (cupin superfamily)
VSRPRPAVAPAIADLQAIPAVPCPCGVSRRAFGEVAGGPATLHLVDISADARAHRHERLTEIYYVLEGEAHIELDGVRHEVRAGMSVMIPPGVRHRLVTGGRRVRILNFVTPPFDPADEHEDP